VTVCLDERAGLDEPADDERAGLDEPADDERAGLGEPADIAKTTAPAGTAVVETLEAADLPDPGGG
jgi:hypothetical protein